MEITKENSEVIGMLRFPLILGVVLIHAYSTQVGMSSGRVMGGAGGVVNDSIQYLFSQILARTAVPLFYLFSGLLLFQGKRLSIDLIGAKWRSRFFTLVLPFILWNTVDLIIQILGQTIPAISHFFTGKTFDAGNISARTLLGAYFDFRVFPVNGPLWFLRELIVLVILSPALYLLVRKAGYYIIILLTLFWLDFLPGVNIVYLSNEALLFFSIGLFLSVGNTVKIEEGLRKGVNANTIISIYILCTFLEVYLRLRGLPIFLIHKVNIILGIAAILSTAYFWIKGTRFAAFLISLAPAAYFVYLTHSSLLQLFKKLTYVIVQPHTDLSFVAIYFLVSILTICSLVGIYRFLSFASPAMLDLLLGRLVRPTDG
jgi:hypothetical protein